MKTLLGYLKPYRRECVLAPLMKLAEALLELLVPLVVASIVDEALPQGDMTLVMRSVLVLFALAAAGALVSVTAQWFSARAASLSARDIKSALLRHIQGLAPADLDRIGTASLINRMNGDMTLVQNGVNMALRLLLRSPFIVLGAAVMAFIVDARAALIFAVTIPVLSLVVYLLLRISDGFRAEEFRRLGLTGCSKDWERLARGVIREFEENNSGEELFHFDSDEDVFCVYSQYIDDLMMLAKMIRAACADETTMGMYLNMSEAAEP